jgi:hypothetical protein
LPNGTAAGSVIRASACSIGKVQPVPVAFQ